MKIKQLQRGGAYSALARESWVFSPTSGLSQASQAQNTALNSSGQSSGRGATSGGILNLFDDKTLGVLKSGGLPNDVSELYTQLASITPEMLNDPNLYNRILAQTKIKANEVKYNKEKFDLAQKIATQNGSLSDYAISPSGLVFVTTRNGEFKLITPKELSRNPQNYQALTNSDLLQLRANNPNFSFNSAILQTVENGVSIEGVSKYIMNLAKQIGSIENTTNSFENSAKVGVNAIFSQTTTTKQADVNAALTMIELSLPQKYKNYLAVTAADKGLDPSSYHNIILDMINGTLNSSVSQITNYEASLAKSLNGGSNAQGNETIKGVTSENQSLQVAQGQGLKSPVSTILTQSATGNTAKITTTEGYHFTSILDNKNEKIMGILSASTLLAKANVSLILKTGEIYLGDLKVSADLLPYVTIDANSGMDSMYLPINSSGAPDFGLFQQLADISAKVKAAPTQVEKNSILSDNKQLAKYIDSKTGEIKTDNATMGRFLVFSAQTSNMKGSNFRATGMIHKGEDFGWWGNTAMEEAYKQAVAIGLGDKKPSRDGFEWFGFDRNSLLQAPLFIPISHSSVEAMIQNNSAYITKESLKVDNALYHQQLMGIKDNLE